MKRHWLRGIAVALIVLPEPFTTPLGVGLLLVSYLLPKRQKDSLRKLETLVTRYLNTREPPDYSHETRPKKCLAFQPVNSNISSLPADRAHSQITLWHYPAEGKAGTRLKYRYATSIHEANSGDKVIHHVLRTTLPQYEVIPIVPEKVIHHTLKNRRQIPVEVNFYFARDPASSTIQQQRVMHHKLKRQ